MFRNAKRDVVTTIDLGRSENAGSIRGHVYSPMLQNEKRTAARLLGAGRIVSHGHWTSAASRRMARQAG